MILSKRSAASPLVVTNNKNQIPIIKICPAGLGKKIYGLCFNDVQGKAVPVPEGIR